MNFDLSMFWARLKLGLQLPCLTYTSEKLSNSNYLAKLVCSLWMTPKQTICFVFGVFCSFPSISKHLGIQLCSSQVTHQKASMYTYHKEALHNNGFCLWTCRFMNDYSNACLTSKLSRWHWYCGCDAKVYLYCIEAKALQKPTWHEYDWKGVLKIRRKWKFLSIDKNPMIVF